jgi:hypothetical protein
MFSSAFILLLENTKEGEIKCNDVAKKTSSVS